MNDFLLFFPEMHSSPLLTLGPIWVLQVTFNAVQLRKHLVVYLRHLHFLFAPLHLNRVLLLNSFLLFHYFSLEQTELHCFPWQYSLLNLAVPFLYLLYALRISFYSNYLYFIDIQIICTFLILFKLVLWIFYRLKATSPF